MQRSFALATRAVSYRSAVAVPSRVCRPAASLVSPTFVTRSPTLLRNYSQANDITRDSKWKNGQDISYSELAPITSQPSDVSERELTDLATLYTGRNTDCFAL
jgi:hypothetical protein